MTASEWPVGPMRRAGRYGDRVVLCHADRPASLVELFDAAVADGADREALIAGETRLDWRALDAAAGAVAAGLASAGIVKGDRVALILANRAAFVIALFGALRLGAVVVPISIREQRGEIEHILRHSGAAAVISGAEAAAQLPEAAACPDVRSWAAEDGPLFTTAASAPAAVPLDELDLAFIVYTSGTTGRPKGAMLTHANVVHSVTNYVRCMALGPDDRTLIAVPMSHVTGLIAQVLVAAGMRGAMIVMEEFKAPAFLALAEREHVTHTLMVPAMYNLLLLRTDLAAANLGTWRVGGYGGAPMPAVTIERLREALPGLTLWNAYGATETASPATMLPAPLALSHRDTVGVALPGADIVVMDADGREVFAGTIGEFWIGGPMVTPGYWNDPAATAANLVGGYWKSGDLGSIDADGFVRVLDRAKDMINRGGYKVFSAEVEAALAAHPDILEVAVVPTPCPVLGERVHAVVVPRDAAQPPAAAMLAAFAAEHLADYKRPDGWTLLDTPLPRNANGKVLKRHLRESVAGGG